MSEKKIKILKNGPYQFKGGIPLNQLSYTINPETKAMDFEELQTYETGETYFLCRCGRTKNYPYCDGSHASEQPAFDGTEVANCPDTNETLDASIPSTASLLENVKCQIHGPVMVKGGVTLEGAEGKQYPRRNNMTLCTCGRSRNKPYCDGSHSQIES